VLFGAVYVAGEVERVLGALAADQLGALEVLRSGGCINFLFIVSIRPCARKWLRVLQVYRTRSSCRFESAFSCWFVYVSNSVMLR